jgi:hypothetical protein
MELINVTATRRMRAATRAKIITTSLLKIVKGKCKRSAKPHVLCFQLIAIEDV